MFITEKEIDQALKDANIIITDENCKSQENHISPQVLDYLEKKWGNEYNETKYLKENQNLKEIANDLLKEISE